MQKSETELEERLVTQAQTVIHKLLAQKAGRHDLSMSEMEGLVGDLEKDIGQAMMQALVEDSPVRGSDVCPKCQGKLRYKGKKPKHMITLRGEIEVERDYYLCPACGSGYFPPR
jgi:YgiT-type zinc finger domain-containing protein